MLPDPYPIPPWTSPCRGTVAVPGSKSLTNRALLLAALGEGRVRLDNALFSRDSQLLCENLKILGFSLDADETEGWISVEGNAGKIPNRTGKLHVGNAGTAARFLTAMVCLHPNGHFHFDGDEEMYRRPMAGLVECLSSLGASFTFMGQKGCFPFEVRTRGLRGGNWRVDASASSQMLSALMMVAPCASGEVRLASGNVRPAFVEMTARYMRQFGAKIHGSPSEGYSIQGFRPYSPSAGTFSIEPDATAASYFLTLPLVVGGSLLVRNMRKDMLQGDVSFIKVLRELGMQITQEPQGWRASAGKPSGAGMRQFDFETFSDTFLTLAAVAPLLPFPVRICGIGHTRHQETDRVAAMATELARAGAPVEEGADSLRVGPFPLHPGLPENVVINTYKDHRVAMSFALLGCRDLRGDGRPWLSVADPDCCSKTFPDYFGKLEKLYQISHDT